MDLVIIKLGGSLITDKSKPYILNKMSLDHVVNEIKKVRNNFSQLRILLINGNGSFGHFTAKEFEIDEGRQDLDEVDLFGLARLQEDTSRLNRILITRLIQKKLPAVHFSISSNLILTNPKSKDLYNFNSQTLETYLQKNFLIVCNGEAVLTKDLNFTTVSSDLLLTIFAKNLQKKFRLTEVWNLGNYIGVVDSKGNLIPTINSSNFRQIKEFLSEAKETDVSGGMKQKVIEFLNLSKLGFVIKIMDGRNIDMLEVINGKRSGTWIETVNTS